MVERRDYIALEWVRGEIEDTLGDAQHALESYQQAPDDDGLLRSAADALHQVVGSLQMVQARDALRLGRAMEALSQALLDNRADIDDANLSLLTRAVQLLPVFLESAEQPGEGSDTLLTLINELRVATGEAPLSELNAFTPELDAVPDEAATSVEIFRQPQVLQLIRKLRQLYQLALLGWLRGQDIDTSLQYLGKAVSRLRVLTQAAPIGPLWSVADAFAEALSADRLTRSSEVTALLRQLDAELRHLLENPVEVAGLPPDRELLKDLLYQLARVEAAGLDKVAAVQQQYRLDEALPEADEPAAEPAQRMELNSAQEAVIQDASASLEEIQDAIADFSGSDWNRSYLDAVPTELSGVRSGLGMVPLLEAEEVLRCVEGYIEQQLLNSEQTPDSEQLAELADAIVGVHYYLERLLHHGDADLSLLEKAADAMTGLGFPADLKAAVEPPWDEELDGGFSALEADDDLDAALDELTGISAADEAEPDTAEPDAAEHEPTAAEDGAEDDFADLAMDAGEERPEADDTSEEAVLEGLDSGHDDLDLSDLDADWLADAEARMDAEPDPDEEAETEVVEADSDDDAEADDADSGDEVEAEAVDADADVDEVDAAPDDEADIEAAEANLEDAPAEEALAEDADGTAAQPEEAEAETTAPADDDILEIFAEEAGEVLDSLAEHYPRYRDNADDSDALAELRRAFHTLKGSGELVGAEAISETAWALENMLSRLIEGTIQRSDDLLSVTAGVIEELPALVDAFAQQQSADTRRVDTLAEKAHQLARGQQPSWDDLDETAVADAAEPEDTDADLLAIFQGELDGHLDYIDQYVEETAPGAAVAEALQRSLHTIKGSANMASVDAVVDLVTPLEHLIREMQERAVPMSAEVLDLLGEGARRLRATADGFREPGDLDYIDRILRAEQALLSAEPESSGLVGLLGSDGMDTLLGAEAILSRWQVSGAAGSDVESLGRELNRLSQQGRELELTPLVELSRGLGMLYESALAGQQVTDDDFFALARSGQQALIDQLDQLAAGQSIASDPAFTDELRRLRPDADPLRQPPAQLSPLDTMIRQDLDDDFEPAAEPSPSPPPDDSPDDFAIEGDSELVGIFLEEARELVDSMQEALEQWETDTANSIAVEGLQRDLHTLKGGARLAEIEPLADLSHEMESLYEGLSQGKYRPSKGLQGLIQQCHDQMAMMVQQIDRHQTCPPATTLIEAIRRFRKNPGEPAPTVTLTTPPAETDVSARAAVAVAPAPSEEVDLDILEIFVEEAGELLIEVEQVLDEWRARPDDDQYADELQRILHTLKGGANLARLKRLGELCHDFESAVTRAQQREVAVDEALFSDLMARQDQLVQGVLSMQTLFSKVEGVGDFGPSVIRMAREQDDGPDETATASQPVARNDSGHRELAPESVKVNAALLESLVNLSGESAIVRARLEQEVSDFNFTLGEMDASLDRLRDQVRHLDMETEAQVLFRQERAIDTAYADFDPLEMDRYSQMQQLSRSLLEVSSDLHDLKTTLAGKARDTESLLLQQGRINSELQEGLMQTRMVPFSRLVPRLRRIVRQVAAELGKEVELVVARAEGELDRTVLERMVSPLEHMLRNAVDHGIEDAETRRRAGKAASGRIELTLAREGPDIVLRLGDDGAGLDVERIRAKALEAGLIDAGADEHQVLQAILEPGFSTAEAVTQISGRGVGMDVVHAEVKQLGGSMSIDAQPGQGTTFSIRLPFTVSVNRALMVRLGEAHYALPLSAIEGIVRVTPAELDGLSRQRDPWFEYAGGRYRLVSLSALLGLEPTPQPPAQEAAVPLILVRGNEETQSVALHVDQLLGSREIVVKSLGPQFSKLAGVAGATILGDGSVVVILDLSALIRHQLVGQSGPLLRHQAPPPAPEPESALRVLVVDDSVTVRKVTSRLLERQGWQVWLAKDGQEAISLLQQDVPDLMLLDIEMPNLDGFEVAQQVRHDERLKQLPIIMITSRTGAKHRQRARAIGVDDYLGKPFQEDVLLETIQRLVEPAH